MEHGKLTWCGEREGRERGPDADRGCDAMEVSGCPFLIASFSEQGKKQGQ